MTDKIKTVIFAEGFFDSCDDIGMSKEEQEELVAKIRAMAEDGSLIEQSEPVDLDKLDEDEIAQLNLDANPPSIH